MRAYLIAGNWKMNTILPTAQDLAQRIADGVGQVHLSPQVQVAVFPPFISIAAVAVTAKGSRIQIGAQNCSNEISGAFTGEISLSMLESVGCNYVLIGHSERRTIYKERNDFIAAKVQTALQSAVVPILCIGETLQERQSHKTWDVLRVQIDDVYKQLRAEQAQRIIIAYEPVWAIGTGIAASPAEAQEAHEFIRNHLGLYLGAAANDTLLLYGGSVTAENAQSLLSQADINGALIGGASLKADAFVHIVSTANELSA